jgi:hypothetical protein
LGGLEGLPGKYPFVYEAASEVPYHEVTVGSPDTSSKLPVAVADVISEKIPDTRSLKEKPLLYSVLITKPTGSVNVPEVSILLVVPEKKKLFKFQIA